MDDGSLPANLGACNPSYLSASDPLHITATTFYSAITGSHVVLPVAFYSDEHFLNLVPLKLHDFSPCWQTLLQFIFSDPGFTSALYFPCKAGVTLPIPQVCIFKFKLLHNPWHPRSYHTPHSTSSSQLQFLPRPLFLTIS